MIGSRKLAPYFGPIRSNTKAGYDWVTHIFPRLRRANDFWRSGFTLTVDFLVCYLSRPYGKVLHKANLLL